ncbi:dehydrin ERD10-like isoform X1 [Prunus avium]|uniref:Dehydrin ERD10-like isoform X1 n=1 Tax=Prunus avium TaxID=42229 RepID=A0A6P5RAV1_PRUAV|nr:dehydrin ERD10-like isoform X1 [Prunus avium]
MVAIRDHVNPLRCKRSMADHYPKETKESQSPTKVGEEGQGCGMFDFLKKKENEKPHQEQEQHKHTLAEKLHHHDGDSSSSSSDEEGGEKKKKGLKGKTKEKISGKKEEGDAYHASVPVEKTHDIENGAPQADEKKGFIEKIKEKLPGQHKEAEHGAHAEYHAVDGHSHEAEPKKGILEKIKDKLPGGHKNEEEKPKEY